MNVFMSKYDLFLENVQRERKRHAPLYTLRSKKIKLLKQFFVKIYR